MDLETAAGSMARIVGNFRMNREEELRYCASIQEALSWMDGYQFDEVCKELVNNLDKGLPKPREYRAAHDKLGEIRGWKKKNVQGRCSTCGGSRFLIACYRNEIDGKCFEAAEPCFSCHPWKDHPRAPNLQKIERPIYEAYLAARWSESREALEMWYRKRNRVPPGGFLILSAVAADAGAVEEGAKVTEGAPATPLAAPAEEAEDTIEPTPDEVSVDADGFTEDPPLDQIPFGWIIMLVPLWGIFQ